MAALQLADGSTALEQAARSESAAADSDERTARADLSFEIARAYWTFVTSIEQLGVVEQSIAATRAHLENARRRLEAGIVAPNDVLAIEAQESRQQLLASRRAATGMSRKPISRGSSARHKRAFNPRRRSRRRRP